MLTIRRVSSIESTHHVSTKASNPVTFALVAAAIMVGLTGCGQKGDLYLADSSNSNALGSEMLSNTDVSQDTASASNDEQNSRYLEKVLADVNENPNDY